MIKLKYLTRVRDMHLGQQFGPLKNITKPYSVNIRGLKSPPPT